MVRRRLSMSDAEPDTGAGNVVTFPQPVRMKNPAAVALGKLGGSKGGNIRRDRLSPERRKEIAQQAARARWTKVGRDRGEGG
jgi:hypothetical protein